LNPECYLKRKAKDIEAALDLYLPAESEYPSIIHKAMRYSVFSGGKRIRPVITIGSFEIFGKDVSKVLPAACAVELIHTYSLIHDDLPALDNDDTRRGLPTCHKKFGEPVAILAGDALLTLAFKLLTIGRKPEVLVGVISEVSNAIGTYGMIGGQVVDLNLACKDGGAQNKAAPGKTGKKGKSYSNASDIELPMLEYIHTHKTGALFAAAAKIGGLMADATGREIGNLSRYGECLGFAFQIMDDVVDCEGYCAMFGESQSRSQAAQLVERAKAHILRFGRKGEILSGIADLILQRRN
jgi:geranylgeranyl diphosphate synthase type II